MKKRILLIQILLIFLITPVMVLGLKNPSAEYCKELGYGYNIEKNELGERGYCLMPGEVCEEWNFFKGKCGKEYSYCSLNGYETVENESGAICVNKTNKISKKNIRAAELMNLGEKLNDFNQNKLSMPKKQTKNIVTGLGSEYNSSDFSFWDWRNPPNNTIYAKNGSMFFDSDYGWVTEIKNQGLCGSCWAFSSAGTLESKYEINENESRLNPDLSEQNSVSCDHSCYPGWTWPSYGCQSGCNGGFLDLTFQYLNETGIVDEDCFSYTGSEVSCSNRCSDHSERTWNIRGVDYSEYSTPYLTDEELEQWIIDKGPLSVAIYMKQTTDGEGFINCGSGGTSNHAVILVGYNDTGDDSTSYWLLKNSWGTSWGQSGYFKIRFNDNCNLGDMVYYVNKTSQPDFKPRINLIEPYDYESTENTKIKFNFSSYNKESSSSTCDLIINGDKKNTTEVENGTIGEMSYNITFGVHEWKIECWEEDFGIKNSSSARALIISGPIEVSVRHPINGSTYTEEPVDINISLGEVADWCGWSINEASFENSMYGSGTEWYDDIDNPSEGEQRIYVLCNNSGGDVGTNNSIYFSYDSKPPLYSDKKEYPESNSSFNSSQNYQFNITWVESGEIGTVLLENNFTGIMENYTVNTKNGDEYYYDQNGLGAGKYIYRWYANDSFGNINRTSQEVYEVRKGLLQGEIVNGTPCVIYYPEETFSTYSENNTGDSDCEYKMWKNGAEYSQNLWTPIPGNYVYKLNVSGCTNYTDQKLLDNKTLTVKKGKSYCNLTSSSGWSFIYGTVTNLSCTCHGEGATRLYIDEELKNSYNNNKIILPANPTGYSIICNISEEEFYNSSSKNSTLNITKSSTHVKLYIDGNEWDENSTADYSEETEVEGRINVSSLEAELLLNGSSVENPYEETHEVGIYNYTAVFNENQNYTSSNMTRFLTVIDTTSPNITNITILPSIVKSNEDLAVIVKAYDNHQIDYIYSEFCDEDGVIREDNLTEDDKFWSLIFDIGNRPQWNYYFNITAVDISGNNFTKKSEDIELNNTNGAERITIDTSLSLDDGENTISWTSSKISLILEMLDDVSDAFIGMSMYEENPKEVGYNATHLNKYLEIKSSGINNELSWAIIRFHYTNDEIDETQIEENKMRVFYYNESEGNWSLQDGGIDLSENFVWANVTHFSTFGVFESTEITTTTTTIPGGGGGGSSGSPYFNTTTTIPEVIPPEYHNETPPADSGNVENVDICGDNICGIHENNMTCPSDCGGLEAKKGSGSILPIIFVFIILIVLGGAGFMYRNKIMDMINSNKKDEPPVPVGIEEIFSQPRKYKGKKVSISGEIISFEYPGKTKNLYEIRDSTGEIFGLSKKHVPEGTGTVEGIVKKQKDGFYIEF